MDASRPSSYLMPPWATELQTAVESGSSRQFVLYGNVHDCVARLDRFISLQRYIEDELLGNFAVIYSYDLGNGLNLQRGAEHLAKWVATAPNTLPAPPLEAMRHISRFRRYIGNLENLNTGPIPSTVVIIRGADQLLPVNGQGFEHGSLTSLIRDWADRTTFSKVTFISILIADNLSDLEPLLAFATQSTLIRVPLPSALDLQSAVRLLQSQYPTTIPARTDLPALAAAMTGVSIITLQQLTVECAHQKRELRLADFVALKKDLVERDAPGLVEFLESERTLDDYYGQDALKKWLRQDIALWQANDLKALPMGYLLCGPIGTGKTFLVECLAGEVRIPVLKLKNFRDKWIGSSEGNLERILRLIRALGRCIVFLDEADQALGRRESGPGDGGLSGRLYALIAQEMANTNNRGKVLWVLASSRPDLIEVDLKRPGRIDVKVPILPTTGRSESAGLIASLARRFDLPITAAEILEMESQLPALLTPGAAEVIVMKAYRLARLERLKPREALSRCLEAYQNPIPEDVLRWQMRLAVSEASDLSFVPYEFQQLIARDTDEATRRR
jgi:ATPase family associated with various cellular activities (AAA)